MLRVELDQGGSGALTVRLQGRLVGLYAEDTRATLSRLPLRGSVTVDLSEVTFVDATGEQLLLWLERLGAKVMAVNLYTQGVCERLHLQIESHSQATPRDPEKILKRIQEIGSSE